MKHVVAALLFLLIVHQGIAQDEEVVVEFIEAPAVEETGIEIFNNGSMRGLRDGNGIILPAEYNAITASDADDLYIVQKEGRYGLYHAGIQLFVLLLEYQDVTVLRPSSTVFIRIKKAGKFGLLDKNYQQVLNVEYDRIESSDQYLSIVKDGKYGAYFVDRTKKDLPVEFTEKITALYPSGHIVAKRDEGYSFFDRSGKMISENNKSISTFYGAQRRGSDKSILVIDQNGKSGIYDSKSNTFVLKPTYDKITAALSGYWIVLKNTQYGVVSSGDKVVIPTIYDTLFFSSAKPSPLVCRQKDHFGLINIRNEIIAKTKYQEVKILNGFYGAKRKGKYLVLDTLGHAITKSTFDDVGNLRYDPRRQKKPEMAVFNNGKMGFMDVSGKLVTPINTPSPARGYKDLNALFYAFAKALKSENDSTIRNFCRDVVYDAYSQDYLLGTGGNYRGFPNEMENKGFTIERIVSEYYKRVNRFYQRLKESGSLQAFTFTGRFDRAGFEYLDQEQTIPFTEPWGIFNTNGRDVEVKLGELLKIDGYWKTFTEFRTH